MTEFTDPSVPADAALPEQPVLDPDAPTDPTNDPAAGQGEVLGSPTPQSGQSTQRDPQDWVTGDDPATEAQKSYLDSLARQAGEEIPADNLTKAQASEHIDRLQAQTGQQPRQS